MPVVTIVVHRKKTKRLLLPAVVPLIICVALPGLVLAQPFGGVIEIDGNCTLDDPGAVDWDLLSATGGAETKTFSGVVADPAPLTTFSGGGSKDESDIPSWHHKDGNVPDKVNIANGMAAVVIAPNGDEILAFAADIVAQNGDAQIGAWVFQDQVVPLEDGTFSGQHLPGDLLILVNFVNGGRIGEVQLWEWQPGGFPIQLALSTASADAQTNAEEVPMCTGDGSWVFTPKFPASNPDHYPVTSFFEAAINLTANNLGGRCFSRFLLETRSSSSIDAVLKDFVSGGFATCADVCGTKFEAAPDTCESVQALAGWEMRLYEWIDTDDGQGGGPDGLMQAHELALVTKDGKEAALANPTCTANDGSYAFLDALPGRTYTVCEVVPERQTGEFFGWAACSPNSHVFAFEAVEGGCTPAPGRELVCGEPFLLTDNICDPQSGLSLDFKNQRIPIERTVTGTAFCDANVNATNDETQGLGDVCVCFTMLEGADGPPVAGTTSCVTTDPADGSYAFPDVQTGIYYLIEAYPDGGGGCANAVDLSPVWTLTTESSTVVFPDPDDESSYQNNDFGFTSTPTIQCEASPVELATEPGSCSAGFCFTPAADNQCGDFATTCEAQLPDGTVVALPVDPATGQVCYDFPGPSGADCGPAATTVTCTVTTDATSEYPELTDSCSFAVNVTDQEVPTVSCQSDATEYLVDTNCETTVTFRGEIADNCCLDASVVVPQMSLETPGSAVLSFDPQTDCVITAVPETTGLTIVCSGHVAKPASAGPSCPTQVNFALNAADCCGNGSAQAVASTVVKDMTPPVFAASCAPTQAVYELDASCETTVSFKARVADTCCSDPPSVTGTFWPEQAGSAEITPLGCSAAPAAEGGFDVTCEATVSAGSAALSCPTQINFSLDVEDCCGNTAPQCTSSTLVVDAQPPQVTCNIEAIDCTNGGVAGDCSGLIGFRATIRDNCCVDAGHVECSAIGEGLVVDPPVCAPPALQADGSYLVTGTARVADVTACPGKVTIKVTAKDCCGNAAACEAQANVGLRITVDPIQPE